jgi:hypothetical protein
MIMVAVLEAMIASTNYANFDQSRDSIQNETISFQNRMTNDFANAAWFFEYNPLQDQAYVDLVTGMKNRLYPKVSSDGSSITVIKLRSSMKIADSPNDERYARVNFTSDLTKPVDFADYIDATPTPVMIMNPDYRADPQWFVAAVWESNKVGLSFDENQDPRNLRHYRYLLETNQDGRKDLVRKYVNGFTSELPPSEEWLLDEVLYKDVQAVTFTTQLEDAELNENQIRISIDIERLPTGPQQNTGAKLKKRIDYTAAMRSIYQDN